MDDSEQTEFSRIGRDAVHTIAIHVTVLLFLYVILAFVAPRLLAVMRNILGNVGPSFDLAVTIALIARSQVLVLLPVAILLLWFDVRVYRRLYVKAGKGTAFLWSYGIVVTLLAFTVFELYALSIPLVKLGEEEQPRFGAATIVRRSHASCPCPQTGVDQAISPVAVVTRM